ncbi:gamma-glutamyl phosphate reductase [Angustibacter aerolatus]|uniref:Gamma-glutamyl phosphate reductase n=1 Tax=Angustibacter aerolatus TaxID=1162965 RepID=A0ABQ6JBZ7_9ACTN|nr:glutamate-5-semialdehyde dehydrogenase [Angustibacter aerolatus]GMA85703.1 gamma-glutamyl phosphate reductase [Angustibacter aerolatus]
MSAPTSERPQTVPDAAVRDRVLEACRRAREAARAVRPLTRAAKDAVLLAAADALDAAAPQVAAANRDDLADGERAGLAQGLLDRLRLDEPRVAATAAALRDLAALPDPVGEVVRGQRLANGLEVRQTRVPMGVVAMVYEARPNVTVDAAGLALKSGNAVVLRGGSAAAHTNRALVGVLREVLTAHGLPADAVTLLDGPREEVRHLMTARGLVDLLIPRGGADLIRTVVEGSTVPVVETGVGNCHVVVDAAADLAKAVAIAVNAKAHRPSVCNAAETLLVHRAVAADFLPLVVPALDAAGVTLHGDAEVVAAAAAAGVRAESASDDDWGREYLSLDLAVRVVDDLDAALAHVRRWSTGHTEAIVSEDVGAVRRFVAEVDAAAVMVNASTRFTDGGELGLGAEIGISTQKPARPRSDGAGR